MDNIPLTEKYRPTKLDEIVYQKDIINILNTTKKQFNIPHLLFHGPPGTGKTSTILAICRQLYGDDFKKKVLELNASDDRGITIIRGKIKDFSKMSINTSGPPFKIIILDEADFLTNDAQSALRRCIETNSNVTRFCIICNYINKIINAIKSRCAILYFKPIPKDIIEKQLTYIIDKEKLIVNKDFLEKIVDNSNGDLRKSINSLQLLSICGDHIDKLFIDNIIDDNQLDNMFKYSKTHNLKSLSKCLTTILNSGISGKVIINNLITNLQNKTKLDDLSKTHIIQEIVKTECSIIDGSDEYIQLFALFINIRQYL